MTTEPSASAGSPAAPADAALYERYLQALALLCECSAYVDEPDYIDRIGEVLADACRHHPLVAQHDGVRWELAPKPGADG